MKWGKRVERMREVIGWDVDNIPDQGISESLDVQWDDLQRIFPYLWHEERVLLSLLRDGKSQADVARIMRYSTKDHARKAIDRVQRVAVLYIKYIEALERLPSVSARLPPRPRRVLTEAIIERKSFADIAFNLNMAESTCAAWNFQRAVRELDRSGEKDLAAALRACYGMPSLRKTSRCPTRRLKAVDPWRDELKRLILSSVGRVWYEWGGQDYDPKRKVGVADCSGFVIEALKAVHKLPPRFRDTTAMGLRRHFAATTDTPLPGDLAFYGRGGRVSHVMFYVGAVNGWDHAVAGMCGGKRNMTREEAALLGANLWVRPSRWYRSDFIGCRRVR